MTQRDETTASSTSGEGATGDPRSECAAENTAREIWREREGDYYADSIFVTRDGGIGLNCGGYCVVRPIREWFRLSTLAANPVFIMDEHGHVRVATPTERGSPVANSPSTQEVVVP